MSEARPVGGAIDARAHAISSAVFVALVYGFMFALWLFGAFEHDCRESAVGTTVSSTCDPRARIEVVEGVAICRCPVEAAP